MGTTVEPPEHRACRTLTAPERRGVESALNQWRLGDSNWRNLYIGTRHVGVIWEPNLPAQVIAAMNGDPDRDEQLRLEGRREANNAITWNTSCLGCAKRLDSLYAERVAGGEEAAQVIFDKILAAYATSQDRALLEATAIALGHTGNRAESTGAASGSVLSAPLCPPPAESS